MPKRLRVADQNAVDAAIAANGAPRAPKRSRGLILTIPGGGHRRLMDDRGALTAAGTYYYEATAQSAPDRRIDFTQEPIRKGARLRIKLRDGTEGTIRTWDGVQRRWRFTKLGHEFYRDSTDNYVVTFPIITTLVRTSGSVYEDTSVVKSTATALGEIKLPTLMSDDDQIAEVKRRAEEFIASLPEDDENRKIIIEGGGSQVRMTLDASRGLEYNREEILRQDGSLTVNATLHRPLPCGQAVGFWLQGSLPCCLR